MSLYRNYRLKILIWIILGAMAAALLPPVPVSAAAPVFTINPAFVAPSKLPQSVTITSDQAGTFTPGSVFPILRDAGGASQSLVLEESSDSHVKIRIPAGVAAGTYTIRIGDPKGTSSDHGAKYYPAGTLEIREPVITTQVPVKNLPKGYNEIQSVKITGSYTSFSATQSVVEILEGTTVVDTPTITGISSVNDYSRELTFALNPGLVAGKSYHIRVTTGSEKVTLNNAIVVRGDPSISLPAGFSLSEGYVQVSIAITGINTGFDSSTTVVVYDGNGDNTGKVTGSPVVTDGTHLSFNLAQGLSAGTYTIKVVTGVETAQAFLAINQPSAALKKRLEDVDVNSVGYANATMDVRLVGTNTSFVNGTTVLTILNASGEDKTAEVLSGSAAVAGQTINFSINRNVSQGSYTVKAVTGGEIVQDTFSIVNPVLDTVTFNSQAYANGRLGKGYLGFPVRITGVNTSFSNNSKVYVLGQEGKVTAITSSGEGNLEFTLEAGLAPAAYELVIDMDGQDSTTNDRFTGAENSSLSFVVTEASISGLSPSFVLNTTSAPATLYVTGEDTHFEAADESHITVRLKNSAGTTVGTISNTHVVSNTSLSFNLVPSSLPNGTYLIEVEVNGNHIVETSAMANALSAAGSGISHVSHPYIYADALGSAIITLTGAGTSFNASTKLLINGMDYSANILNNAQYSLTATSLSFTVPTGLSAGVHEIKVVETGKSPYVTSFEIKPARTIALSPTSALPGYQGLNLLIESNDTIAFNHADNRPSITISGPGGFSRSILPQAYTSYDHDNSVLSFLFPEGGGSGYYTLTFTWSSGEHLGKTITLDNAFAVAPQAPSANPPGGLYNGAKNVVLSHGTGGTATYYTLDGSEPDSGSQQYNGAVTVDGNDGETVVLKAVSYDAAGNKGLVMTQSYQFDKVGPAAPTASVAGGTYNTAKSVVLTHGAGGIATYYTLDGSEPDSGSMQYNSAIPVDGSNGETITLKAVSYDAAGNKGFVMTQTYIFDKAGPFAPAANVESGTYNTAKSIVLTHGAGGTATYYTLNGSEPDNSSTLYSGAILIDGNHSDTITLKAVSYDALGNKGAVMTKTYVFDKVGPAAPTASVAGGTYNTAKSVVLTHGAGGNATYYTLDGSEPTNQSTQYSSAITVDGNHGVTVTLKAVSYDAAGNKGNVLTVNYVFNKASTPPVDPGDPGDPTHDPDTGSTPGPAASTASPTSSPSPSPTTGLADEVRTNADGSQTLVNGNQAVTRYNGELIEEKLAGDVDGEKVVLFELPLADVGEHRLLLDAEAVRRLTENDAGASIIASGASLQIPSSVFESAGGREVAISIKSIDIGQLSETSASSDEITVIGGNIIELTITAAAGDQEEEITTFDEGINLAFPVEEDSLEGKDTRKLGIYYLDETSKKWIYVGGRYNAETGSVEAENVRHFTKFAVIEYNKSFIDVPETHWAKDYIEVFAARHITTGVDSEGMLFDLGGTVTRGQFATFISRALNLPLGKFEGKFSDVKEGAWYALHVEAAFKAGITGGVGGSLFMPDAVISRQEMATMIMRAYSYVTGESVKSVAQAYTPVFNDMADVKSWAVDSVIAANGLGIIGGIGGNNFGPAITAVRCEAAKMIVLLLERLGKL